MRKVYRRERENRRKWRRRKYDKSAGEKVPREIKKGK
jgi:hypothetical protein